MTLPSNPYDLSGNTSRVDAVNLAYDSQTNAKLSSTTCPTVCAGTGAPTFSAGKGSLYLRIDGSTTNDRAYINTNGSTTWTTLTTAG